MTPDVEHGWLTGLITQKSPGSTPGTGPISTGSKPAADRRRLGRRRRGFESLLPDHSPVPNEKWRSRLNRHMRTLMITAAVLLLAGCGSLSGARKLFSSAFTGESMSDQEMVGFTLSDPTEPDELDVIKTAAAALQLPSQAISLLDATILEIGLIGEREVRKVKCPGPLAAKCRTIPVNTEVRVSGVSAADGTIIATRVVFDRRP